MPTFSTTQAITWCANIFARHGAATPAATSVARALVAAQVDGLAGHGLSRIPTYLTMLAAGKINGNAVPVASRPRPGVLLIDAAEGFAYPAIDLAMRELPEIARTQGTAAAGIARSNHCGAAGLHVEGLAEAGLVALMFANTPAAMAPWGGHQPIFGTNPIAFAAPIPGQPPLVIDMALSRAARGNVVAASLEKKPIPEGWALDSQGRPTTDAEAALLGTMVPMGDAKGAVLALMIEVLAAGLIGANFAFTASSFLDGQGGAPNTGQFILAFDPGAFTVSGDFAGRMAELAAVIKDQAGARLPGSRRMALRETAKREGVAISDALIAIHGSP